MENTTGLVKTSWFQKQKNRNYIIAFLFVLPALINFTVFRYYPMIWAFRASFWDYSLLQGFKKMVGFDNYIRAFTGDPVFIQSLKTTFIYAFFYVIIIVALALALSVFANQKKPGVGAIRAIIFIPVVTSFIVVSIVWGMLLNPDLGIVNGLLQTIGLNRLMFLTSKTQALPTLIGVSVWKDVGYSVIILVAGLKGVSEMYYEAAIVDGANSWQRFWYVTLPSIKRQLMFVVVWATMGAFQVFIPVYSLTQGGPSRSTNVVVYYIYKEAFIFGQMGYASALSIILLLILLVVSVFQMRILRSD
jgi:ABC-type sugar transport system permease subunit